MTEKLVKNWQSERKEEKRDGRKMIFESGEHRLGISKAKGREDHGAHMPSTGQFSFFSLLAQSSESELASISRSVRPRHFPFSTFSSYYFDTLADR